MSKAVNIKWDTDGNNELLKALPQEVEIPEELANADAEEISDWLTDGIGYCHCGFDLRE